MAEDVPSQLTFSHLLSHTFPGIFPTIGIFLVIFAIFSNPTSRFQLNFLFEGWTNFIAALGGLVFFATILGILIDFLHHDIEDHILKPKFLFSWGDNKSLIVFLKQNFGIEGVETAKIEETNDRKGIKVSAQKNELSLRLNNDEKKVNLEIDDGRTDEFIAKREKDKLKIYNFTKEIKELYKKQAEIFKDIKNEHVSLHYYLGFLPIERFQYLHEEYYSYVECRFNLAISFLLSAFIYSFFFFLLGYDLLRISSSFILLFFLSIYCFHNGKKRYIKFLKFQIDFIKGSLEHLDIK